MIVSERSSLPRDDMLLIDIARASQRVAGASARLEKIGHLASCLRSLSPDEVDVGVALLSGEPRQGRIGVGPSTLEEARCSGAAHSPTLTLKAVDTVFDRVATLQGPGSTAGRVRLLGELFERATPEEQDFLARLVLGELRQGALKGLLIEGIARAAEVSASEVRRALMLTGDPASVARTALAEGRSGLRRFSVRLFRPLQPMLAQPAEDLSDAIRRLANVGLEWKLDGARVQVHKSGQEVRVYSRRLNDVTVAVPEIVEVVRSLPAREILLDGETLALRADGSPHPFQVTMRRFGRKLDVERVQREIPLTPFFFDCLYVEGETLLDRPAAERFAALAHALPAEAIVPRIVTADSEQGEAFLQEALRGGHEGMMAKALEAPYEAGRRGQGWLKVKPSHTLDLVVLAAEWGHGRRRGWLSNLHLGARNPAGGGFVMLGKTFKGMTDAMLAWQTQKLQEVEVGRDAHTVHVHPVFVVEVAFNEVQASPKYPAGLALRFARVKRYRPDKRPDDADTIDAVREIFARQVSRGGKVRDS